MEQGGSLGIRTPIHFGEAIEHLQKGVLDGWKPLAPRFDSERFLLYVFQKPLDLFFHGFVVIQGARKAGKFTVEFGMSLVPKFPVHYGMARPSLVTFGVRERAALIYRKDDLWWQYHNQDKLESQLQEVVTEITKFGFNHLTTLYAPKLHTEVKRAEEFFADWMREEAAAGDRPLGARYDSLKVEDQAYLYIGRALQDSSYMRILEPFRKRYMDHKWQAAHTYLMATLMETVLPREMFEDEDRIPQVEDDEVYTIAGRVPPYQYLDIPAQFEQRSLWYCFFKALEMLDALYDSRMG